MSRFQSAIEVCSKERIQVIAGARRIQSICSTAMFFSYCVHAFLETNLSWEWYRNAHDSWPKRIGFLYFPTTGSHSNPTAGIGLFTSYIWLQLPPLRNWSVKAWRHQFEHQNPLKYLLPKRTAKAVWTNETTLFVKTMIFLKRWTAWVPELWLVLKTLLARWQILPRQFPCAGKKSSLKGVGIVAGMHAAQWCYWWHSKPAPLKGCIKSCERWV